ncbi:MAG TPA: SMP-30/gluconolactonase/LRE family protein [Candidatus Limnocylindria bacterium]|jgi:virginiamycin B lyase|nr:SMP-30/gluconolactonase/LRE family protein [Candidatus Limnocylindria bacterium]
MTLLRIAVLALALSVACSSSLPDLDSPSRFPSVAPSAAPAASASAASPAGTAAVRTPDVAAVKLVEFPVGRGQGPHDVAAAPDGGVWYTAQRTGELGYLDPKTGATRMVRLGSGSSPHGVIVGPDGAPWVTDSGQNAIVRVDPVSKEVKVFKLPGPNVNLNTAAFDRFGMLWFTGQSGFFGHVDPKTSAVKVLQSPRGAGPYGITSTPDGAIFYASLANSHIASVDLKEDVASPIDPPTARQGARRVWSDSKGQIWVSEWNVGQVGVYYPDSRQWKEWKIPGADPMPYAVYVDDADIVWLTDFGANAIVRFDPRTETFTSYPHAQANAAVRQLLGRPGEVWGAMSGQDKLLLIRTR